jgi:hypothetical protein
MRDKFKLFILIEIQLYNIVNIQILKKFEIKIENERIRGSKMVTTEQK